MDLSDRGPGSQTLVGGWRPPGRPLDAPRTDTGRSVRGPRRRVEPSVQGSDVGGMSRHLHRSETSSGLKAAECRGPRQRP